MWRPVSIFCAECPAAFGARLRLQKVVACTGDDVHAEDAKISRGVFLFHVQQTDLDLIALRVQGVHALQAVGHGTVNGGM